MSKKDFTKAANSAIDKFFSINTPADAHDTHDEHNTNDMHDINDMHITNDMYNANVNNVINHANNINHTDDSNITKHTYIKHNTDIGDNTNNMNIAEHTRVTNKSKHYDDRGKRGERYGILLDGRLKEDLRDLANATGSRSVNDLIVTVLLEYAEKPENRAVLEAYKKLRGGLA